MLGSGTKNKDWLAVAALYLTSTALYAFLGVTFDATPLATYMQFIERDLLEHRLLESLWYYHGNPPLLNFLAGIGLKLAGDHAPHFYNAVFHLAGVLTAWCVFALTLRLSGSRWAAIITTAVLVFSPQFVLYENWLMYEFLSMALLTFSAYALYEFVERRGTRWGVAFFAALATLLLLRSLFHLAWLVLVAVLLVVLLPGRRRQVLTVAVAPVLLVALWYGKNAYYFGTFSASTWMGLGLSNITTLMVPEPELRALVQKGDLSQWALVSRYKDTSRLFHSDQQPPTGIPVLGRQHKSENTFNFNFRDIPQISRYYAADGVTVARRFPASYALGLVMANRLYFSPTSMNLYFAVANREAVYPIERAYNVATGAHADPRVMGAAHFGFTGDYTMEVNFSLLLCAGWWTVLGYGFVQTRRGIVRGEPDARALTIGFIVLTAAYLYVVSTALELSENFRYRFNIEPLFFVLAATALTAFRNALPNALWLSRLRLPGRAAPPS